MKGEAVTGEYLGDECVDLMDSILSVNCGRKAVNDLELSSFLRVTVMPT